MVLKRFFKEIYVVLGFYPWTKGLHGSTGFTKKFPAVAVFVNERTRIEEILDLVYHEALHMLFRLNNVTEITGNRALEETLLDFICPNGYISIALGLKRTIKISPKHYQEFKELYDKLKPIIKEYFERRRFERTSILEYLKKTA